MACTRHAETGSDTVRPAAQEFTRCVARVVDPLMDAQGGPEPWRDSGLESVYAGLPFWVNATSAPAPAAQACNPTLPGPGL